jgi:uncharacterized membrane protein
MRKSMTREFPGGPVAEAGTAASTIAGVTVEQVAFDAPWNWLARGWRDLWTVPRVSLTYGVVFAALSMGLTLGLMASGLASLVLALGGGFLLIGPIAAVGLYETSRRLESGQSAGLRDGLKPECTHGPARLLRRHPGVRVFRVGADRLSAVHAVHGQQAAASGN